MGPFEQYSEMELVFVWVECYGGPADGEQVPVDPIDPIPDFPYMMSDGQTHWYRLRRHADGRYRYFLAGLTTVDGWTQHNHQADGND